MSQAQLGAPYYTRAHVSAIELGKIRPAMKSLEHMAAKLARPSSYFLEDAGLERARRELDFDVERVAALASRTTAADCLRDAADLLERASDRDRLLRVRVLQALGAVSVDLGEPQAAFGYLNSALEWAQDVGDLTSLFAIYYALAVSHRAQSDLEAATTYLQRALATS